MLHGCGGFLGPGPVTVRAGLGRDYMLLSCLVSAGSGEFQFVWGKGREVFHIATSFQRSSSSTTIHHLTKDALVKELLNTFSDNKIFSVS